MVPAESGQREMKAQQQQRLMKEAATAVEMAIAAGAAAKIQSILTNIWEFGNQWHSGYAMQSFWPEISEWIPTINSRLVKPMN